MQRYLKVVFLIVILVFAVTKVSAFELDMSVDDDIRKNYNPSKLEYDVLPELPGVIKNSKTSQPDTGNINKSIQNAVNQKTNSNNTSIQKSQTVSQQIKSAVAVDSFTEIKVRKGTKFKVKSQTNVSDWNTAGARMTFVSISPVTKRYISFPVGTIFKGVIEDSHQPNYAGNGGLLKIKADKIIIDGVTENLNAKVVKAAGKNIYFNNIKGQRGYIKGIGKQIKKGENFYQKTRATSNKLSSNPVGLILSPIPIAVGVIAYAGNLVVSPVSALWSKGSHITIPSGSNYVIKLKDDLYINK